MSIKINTIITAALFSLVFGFGIPAAQASGCLAGEKIDGSSLGSAKKKMEKAGFVQVRDLKKSCDNFWHANADKGGERMNIVLSPQGQVIVEGN